MDNVIFFNSLLILVGYALLKVSQSPASFNYAI